MDLKRAYKILEIPENTSLLEAKQAYHDLAQIWHPDRQPHNDRLRRKAEAKMKELNEAYDFICLHLRTDKTGYFTDEESKHRGPTEQTIVCPQCGTKNRIPSSINNSRAKCGRCGTYLFHEQHGKQTETEERKSWVSCGDGACIGHIDSTGKCRNCGKTYEEGIAAERDRTERRRQQQQNQRSWQPHRRKIIVYSLIGVVVLFLLILNNSKSPSGDPTRNTFPAKELARPASPPKVEAKPAEPAIKPEEVVWDTEPGSIKPIRPPGIKIYSDTEEAKSTAPVSSPNSPEPDRTPRPSYVQQPLPPTGYIRKHTDGDSIAPFQIKAAQGNHYLVKLVDVVSNESVADVFVRSGTTVDVEVPLGSYEVRYASGEAWYGYRDQSKDYFGPSTVYSKAEKIFTFQKDGIKISGYTITLYKVPHGNLHTSSIKPTQF